MKRKAELLLNRSDQKRINEGGEKEVGFASRVIAQKIRESVNKEDIVSIDCGYIGSQVEEWWKVKGKLRNDDMLVSQLTNFLDERINQKDRQQFLELSKLGNSISGVCITGLFSNSDARLGYIVHEAMSNLFKLKDMKYPYEDHKKLYVKPEGLGFKEWGKGRGEITPHCDDLYEEVETDLLSLTVSKDETKTPTTFYRTKDIVKGLSDSEIEKLSKTEAVFISGKNVEGDKMQVKKIIEYDETNDDVRIAMDFRIDDEKGRRMMPRMRSESKLLEKIGDNFDQYEHVSSVPETGTFLIVANRKGLHSREMLKLTDEQIQRVKEGDVENAPRLLYRSKGPTQEGR